MSQLIGAASATVHLRTLLGVAVHDLITDARVADGLRVRAWPLDGGRVTAATQTASGAYGFHGLDGMRRFERPSADDPDPDDVDDADRRTFVVEVVDRKRRYLDLVLTVQVPRDAPLLRGDVLDGDAGLDELPLYLFPAPQRPVPTHLAAIRADVADQATGEPVPWCRIDVVVDPDGAARRSVGIADASGSVLLAVPYPRFPAPTSGTAAPGEPYEPPVPGTRGTPVVGRTWPITVSVRSQPDLLVQPPGARAPALDGVLGQGATDLWATSAGPPGPELSTDLHHGVDLILHTDGDPASRLLIEGASP